MKSARTAAVVVALAATALQARAMTTRDVVVDSNRSELGPAASETHVAWAQWENGTHQVYVKELAGGAKTLANNPDWSGYTGGISGNSLVYQQYSQPRGRSDIFLFDLVSETRERIPAPVSTDAWEYGPSISGDRVLFARWFPNGDRRLILYDMSKDKATVIAASAGERWNLTPGQVSGDFVVWDKWSMDAQGDDLVTCNVFRHRISTGQTTRLNNPSDLCQYGSAVSSEGTVYFARNPFVCGKEVRLRRLPLGGTVKTILELPAGRDTSSLFAADRSDGKVELYYDRVVCNGDSDIWSMTVP